jgi:hypothetical protein
MGRIGEPGLASVHPIFFQPKGKKKDKKKWSSEQDRFPGDSIDQQNRWC